MFHATRNKKIEELRAQDRVLIQELATRAAKRNSPPREIQALLHTESDFTLEQIKNLEQQLADKGALEIATRKVTVSDTDGQTYTIPIFRAATTEMWPMGTNWYARDHVLIPARFLEASRSSLTSAAEYGQVGRELLISVLTMFSTQAQLRRFRNVIEAADGQFPHRRENWPQVFLTIKDNLNGSRAEFWAHKQDAWQMLAYHTLRAIEQGDLKLSEVSAGQKQFLAYVLPFLAKIQYWQEENSGSWEELTARRSSVMAWEMAAVEKISSFAERSDGKFLVDGFAAIKQHLPQTYQALDLFQTADVLIAKGKEALLGRLPYESPDYEKTDPRYRDADAALIYLLQLGTPEFLGQPDVEAKLLVQIESLTDARTGAIRRYLNDSYQGKSFFRNETALYLSEVYGAPSGDASGPEQWVARRAVVPAGPEAAWTHFVWQMSAWAGRRYQETGEKKYWDMQQQYFHRGLRLITGEGEVSVDLDEHEKARVIDLPAWRIPECYITDEGPNSEELIFPSPHTPLNWAVAEAIDALAMVRKSLEMIT